VDNRHIVAFDQLLSADLIVDCVYRGGQAGGFGDEPLSKLLPVRNLGGFRSHGRPTKLVALYTSGEEPDGRTPWIRTRVPSSTTGTIAHPAARWMTRLAEATNCSATFSSGHMPTLALDGRSRPSSCSTSLERAAATCDPAVCSHLARTASAVKRIWWRSGVQLAAKGSRTIVRVSRSWMCHPFHAVGSTN
jgi:hypothetical protein